AVAGRSACGSPGGPPAGRPAGTSPPMPDTGISHHSIGLATALVAKPRGTLFSHHTVWAEASSGAICRLRGGVPLVLQRPRFGTLAALSAAKSPKQPAPRVEWDVGPNQHFPQSDRCRRVLLGKTRVGRGFLPK